MEILNQYSGLFSLIAAIAAVVAIFVAVYLSNKSSKQIDRIHKDWDKKRRYSSTYDAYAEFQDQCMR